MTSLTYMVRQDWGQNGTAMEPQSKIIRDWIGAAPYLFAVVDSKELKEKRPADLDVIDYVAPDASTRRVFNIAELASLKREDKTISHAVVVVHPHDERELEVIRNAVEAESIERLFVMVWSPHDQIRMWLDGLGALDLHTGEAAEAADPLMVAAAEMMVSYEYNGLGSGHGKDAVVQLVRAFALEGYAVDVHAWLRAYFAAGGSFRHSGSVVRLVGEMASGTKHRVRKRFRDDIFTLMQHKPEN